MTIRGIITARAFEVDSLTLEPFALVGTFSVYFILTIGAFFRDALTIYANFIGFALIRNARAAFFVLAFRAWVFLAANAVFSFFIGCTLSYALRTTAIHWD